MSYALPSDIIERVDARDVAKLASDRGEWDRDTVADGASELLTAIIADADARIDSYVAARYTVPLSPVPASIRNASVMISTYWLHMRRTWTVTPELKTAYDDTIAWLRDVAAGKADLPANTISADARGSFTSNDRQYTRTTLEGFL